MSDGFTWDDYVATLVAREGTLTAVAEKLAAAHAYADDVASVERALRRLRGRELRPGGKWGTRLVALFGLPDTVERRLRWMAAYHSRFADLPVPVCEDLAASSRGSPISVPTPSIGPASTPRRRRSSVRSPRRVCLPSPGAGARAASRMPAGSRATSTRPPRTRARPRRMPAMAATCASA